MKKIIAGLLSLMMVALAGFSLAQDATPTTGVTAVAPQGKSEVRERLRFQKQRIQQGFKSGVLSKDQATALMDKLKSIGDQVRADFNANGKKPLTDDQKTQINQLLDENSKAIYQAKHPGQTASTTAPDDSNDAN
ncbi:MAG TPA: hypothetical protein VK791_09435 [bacterium]|jgi:hypothetical protein|nr:hypothetical protein [bacterium]